MDMTSFVQALVFCVFPFLLVFAAVSDLVTMTISNRISILLTAGFIGLALIVQMPFSAIGIHFAVAALVLFIGFAMFAFGWIGGGDAKLAAAISLWLGFDHTLEFAIVAAILGGLLSLFIISTQNANLSIFAYKIEWLERFLSGRKGIPYGIALSAGALIIYPETFWLRSIPF